MSSKEKIGYRDIFRQKEYMKMILAALINRFGDSIDAIASAWIVYELTSSAAWSAVMYGINRIPSIVVTPFAGAWVEGRNKKKIMVITDFIRAMCVALIATGYLFDFLNVGILVLTTVIISTVEAFRGPANTALTPKVLERKYYEYGMSLMSVACSVVELIGMGAAAGIIAVLGTAGAIYVDMATFALSALIILTVRTKENAAQKQKFDAKEYMKNFGDGVAYARKEKTVFFFCGIAVYLNAVLVPFNSMQAALVEEILGGGAEVLSVLGIALTVGMMLGTSLYPLIGKVLNSRSCLTLCCLGLGLYYIGFVAAKPLYANSWLMYGYVAVASCLCGIMVSIFSSFLNVEFLKKVDETYLARAASIMTSLSSIAVPVASFVISAAAASVRIDWLFVAAGVLAILACPLFLSSKVMRNEKRKVQETECMQEVV